jgi:hypothetical protein
MEGGRAWGYEEKIGPFPFSHLRASYKLYFLRHCVTDRFMCFNLHTL